MDSNAECGVEQAMAKDEGQRTKDETVRGDTRAMIGRAMAGGLGQREHRARRARSITADVESYVQYIRSAGTISRGWLKRDQAFWAVCEPRALGWPVGEFFLAALANDGDY